MTQIELHYSLEIAHNILEDIEEIIAPELAKDCTVESFSNGREQGLFIQTYSERNYRCVGFAQQRNSDNIVIYWGVLRDFDVTTHLPVRDEVWDRNLQFSYDEVEGAARWVVMYLESGETP
ncbi:hypothetical protein ACQ4M3_09680 [Leptolyngbya sp. AN03gr2]|uniref:hypothetical protein n=1 Tax=Leptolyngbya sp. AN03gr2 TaxID=3423364 RepID=UPI003D31FCD1